MSKSAENPNNYIALLDSPEIIREKIKVAVTDSGNKIKYDAENKPAISNLLLIYSLFSGLPADRQGKSIPILEKEYAGKIISLSKDLAEVIIEGLSPIQKKYQELSANPDYVKMFCAPAPKKPKPSPLKP